MARPGYETATYTWDGKRHYCYGKTKEEAKTKADKQLALLEAGVRKPKGNYSVESWGMKWLRDYKKGAVSEAWYKQIEGILRNHIFSQIGDKRMKDVTAADIQRLMNQCSHYSESHQKQIAQIVRQIFDSAEENGVVVKVPIKRIKIRPRPSQSRTRTITDRERMLTLKVADEHLSDGIFFLIMLYCGCRPQEVSRLKMGDYDRERSVIFVHEARKADGSTAEPKSKSGIRLIPVPNYLAERLNMIDKADDEYIVTSTRGTPLSKTSQRRLWNRFRRWMDIENGAVVFRNAIVQTTLADDLRPYCYRHTYCTDLQDAGVPLTVAQQLMGHRDIKMTAEIYTHRTDKSFEDARDKLNALHSE